METKWHKCYDDGWQGIIAPEAFSHPAKMAYGLLKRILSHAFTQGWLSEGDVIIDPFGGIGSTGILGAYEGYQVVCCELEAKFVKLAEQNFELHKDAWVEFGNPYPVILQGDSRQLCQIVEKADCIVASPPFCESSGAMAKPETYKGFQHVGSVKHKGNDTKAGYGQTPGQLGSMKPGKVDMVVSSPPYAESMEHSGGIDPSKSKYTGGPNSQMNRSDTRYGQTKGNLGNLKSGDVDCVISSPPWENSQEGASVAGPSSGMWKGYESGFKAKPGGKIYETSQREYGQEKGQLGQAQGDTFWQAAKTIVEQCHQILKPGGHAIWVVKSFVRKKKIVDFPGDWQKLCESVGFKTVCVHHAMLVKETKHQTLFGDTEVKRKERKSFFRRLAESKGSPRIDFEVVLCMQNST